MKHIDPYRLFESSDSSYHMITIKDLLQEYIDDYDLIRMQFRDYLTDRDLGT